MTAAAPNNGRYVPAKPKPGPIVLFIRSYRLDPTFRGFVDFAVIGAIVLAFLHPPGLPSWNPSNITLPWAAQSKSSKKDTGPISQFRRRMAELTKSQATQKPLPPRKKGSFERALFKSSPPDLRLKLVKAADAFEARRPQQTLKILEGANGKDPNVIFLRGFASLTLPGGMNRQYGERLIRQAADMGQRQASTIFGKLKLARMPGIRQEPEIGLEYLKRAAEAGDAYAAHYLSRSYMNGLTGSIDAATAIRYLRMAGENGSAGAIFELAMAHDKGFGVPKDQEEFLRLLEKAATLGHDKAEIVLGLVHFSRYMEGLAPDIQPSVDWLIKAGRKQNPEAFLWLGRIFTQFKDMPFHNPERGAGYTKHCTVLGHADCFAGYGMLLNEGTGVERDPVMAHAYFDRAIKLGSRRASALIKPLKSSLTPAEKSQANEISIALKQKSQRSTPNLIPMPAAPNLPTSSRVRPGKKQ